jgi:UDP-glucuronate 4-epimerase
MTRVLVTGASGFIGAHLCASLAKKTGIELAGLDSFSNYYSVQLKRRRVDALMSNQRIDLLTVDISDEAAVDKVFIDFQPEVVVHLAAQAGIRLNVNYFSQYVNSNLTGFANILTAAVRHKTRSLLYASSSSVYGNAKNQSLPESMESLLPTSFYGATKLSNEILARSISSRNELRTRGLRFFTVYGPWGRPDMAYFRILEALLNNRTFHLNGDGSIERDFTFVSDVIEITESLLNDLELREESFSDVVNLGGGSPHSMKALIGTLERLSERNLRMELKEWEPGDVRRTESDRRYAESLLGKRNFVTLERGLDDFLAWGTNSENSHFLADWVNSSYRYTN